MANKTLFIKFQSLPSPIRYGSYVYVGSLIVYNIGATYIDSTNFLKKYRNGEVSTYNNIKNDWEAVKYGASENFWSRLVDSIVWPVSLCSNIIPYIVLSMNPKK